ncbi:MAG: hypothetical protein ACREAB_01825, partial [Blastocatellia bacterium]
MGVQSMSFQNKRPAFPRWPVLPIAFLLCVTAFDSNPAAAPKIGAALQQSKPDTKTKAKEAPRLKPGKG